jgi:hypothetical protein
MRWMDESSTAQRTAEYCGAVVVECQLGIFRKGSGWRAANAARVDEWWWLLEWWIDAGGAVERVLRCASSPPARAMGEQ